jgi:hypothetical protein
MFSELPIPSCWLAQGARGVACFVVLLSVTAGCGCRRSGTDSTGAPGQSSSATDPGVPALSPEQAARVLAKVGDRVITLGDYLAAVQRLDRFERLRYQSPERRRLLLDEMINLELLAREAERRGLDRSPELKGELRLLQRQEAERQLRAQLPAVGELPLSEVRAYYETHAAEFREPERRRAAILRLPDRELAQRVLGEAKLATPEQWGELVRKYSTLEARPLEPASKNNARPPREFEGDVGFVSASGEGLGANALISPAVRKALFEIKAQGELYPEVISDDAGHQIVRLIATSAARQRNFTEAETTIRVQLLEQQYRTLESDLLKQLATSLPIQIDEAALAELAAAPGAP